MDDTVEYFRCHGTFHGSQEAGVKYLDVDLLDLTSFFVDLLIGYSVFSGVAQINDLLDRLTV